MKEPLGRAATVSGMAEVVRKCAGEGRPANQKKRSLLLASADGLCYAGRMLKSGMSESDNKRIARALLEEVINRREPHRIPEFIAPDYQAHHFPLKGIAGFEEHYRTFIHLYPDLQVKVEGQVAEGDLVVTWYTATGTHEGVWHGIKATHRPLHLSGVNVLRIRDGRIVEQWGGSNSLEALLELGVITWVKS